MRLLYITNGINGAGGLERVLSVKASLLAESPGYEVFILVLNNGDRNCFYKFSEKITTISILVNGNPFQYLKSYKKGIVDTVKEIKPDVISVCDDGLKGFFVPQILKYRKGIIYERHVSKLIDANNQDGLIKKIVNNLKWWIMEKKAKDFSRFVVLTDGNKNEWQTLENLQVISNPLSFYPDQQSDLKNKKVICVGKISYQKGQDLLLSAWEIVNQNFPDWELELYGKIDADYFEKISLDKINVKHFPPDSNIEQKYIDSTIYVMSSRFEGFGMVLIEAMACGVPCISFDCNYGPSDIIKNNENGFLVEKEDIFELADRIMYLIQNENLRIEFGKKARENVKKYLPSNIISEWERLFKNIV